jgi:hypothetical protein
VQIIDQILVILNFMGKIAELRLEGEKSSTYKFYILVSLAKYLAKIYTTRQGIFSKKLLLAQNPGRFPQPPAPEDA